MSTLSRVVLIGASGTLGLAVLKVLQSSPEITKVTILTRSSSPSTPPKSFPADPKTTVIPTDYSAEKLPGLFTGHDAVIITAGLSSLPLHPTIITACVQANIGRLITDDFGNHPDYAGLPELEPLRATKTEILEITNTVAAASSSLPTNEGQQRFSWTALATGHFLDVALHRFPQVFGFDVPRRHARIVDGGAEPFSATTTADIAIAVRGVLLNPEPTANRWCMVRSAVFTQNAILDALREHTGGEWDVTYVESKELLESGRKKLAEGDRRAHLDLIPVQLFEKGANRNIEGEGEYDNELLGVRVRSVREVISEVLKVD